MDWITITLAIVVLLGLMYVVYHMKMSGALVRTIRTMKKYNAVGEANAKSRQDMNLTARSVTSELLMGSDYSDQAILELRRLEIVGRTSDGRLYLVEEKLAASKWKNM
jgi:hypothetical protein